MTGVDPVLVTEYSVIFSVVALPLTYIPILLVANDRAYMGQYVNGRLANTFGLLYLVVILIVSITAIPLMILTNRGRDEPAQELDLGLGLLDHQLVDCEGRRCGNVDDLELEGLATESHGWRRSSSDRRPGSGRGWLGGWLAAFVTRGRAVRVPWEEVEKIDAAVHLRKPARELRLGRGDDRARKWIEMDPGILMRFTDLLGTRGDAPSRVRPLGPGARPPRRAHTAHAEDHRARRRTESACSSASGSARRSRAPGIRTRDVVPWSAVVRADSRSDRRPGRREEAAIGFVLCLST